MYYINSNNDKEVLSRLYIARLLFFVIFLEYATYLFLVNKSNLLLIKFRMPEVCQYR